MVLADIKKQMLKLSQYKRPTNIIIQNGELPKTATKKIKRLDVKKLVGA